MRQYDHNFPVLSTFETFEWGSKSVRIHLILRIDHSSSGPLSGRSHTGKYCLEAREDEGSV